jgi:hypothetical protein
MKKLLVLLLFARSWQNETRSRQLQALRGRFTLVAVVRERESLLLHTPHIAPMWLEAVEHDPPPVR